MATFQFAKSSFPPTLRFRLLAPLPRRVSAVPLRCRLQKNGDEPNGEDLPESLFMKELKRRGMNPTSLLEDSDGGPIGSSESREEISNSADRRRGQTKWNDVAWAAFDKATSNQRERSMSLNSEGLEGLIPRAKLLLTIGGTFFLGLWPLILITVGFILCLYNCLGLSFVHDASKVPVWPPPYIDPSTLLEDERISQVASHVI